MGFSDVFMGFLSIFCVFKKSSFLSFNIKKLTNSKNSAILFFIDKNDIFLIFYVIFMVF
jgi:hypothetical protein